METHNAETTGTPVQKWQTSAWQGRFFAPCGRTFRHDVGARDRQLLGSMRWQRFIRLSLQFDAPSDYDPDPHRRKQMPSDAEYAVRRGDDY